MSRETEVTVVSDLNGKWIVDLTGHFTYDPSDVRPSNEDREDTLSYTITFIDGTDVTTEQFEEKVTVLAQNPGLADFDSFETNEDDIYEITRDLEDLRNHRGAANPAESWLSVISLTWCGSTSIKLAWASISADRWLFVPRIFRLGLSGLRWKFICYADKARIVNLRSIMTQLNPEMGEAEIEAALEAITAGQEVESIGAGVFGMIQEFAEEMMGFIIIVAGVAEVIMAENEADQLRRWEREVDTRREKWNRSVDRFFNE